jgi:hypothetical protein
MKVPVRVILLVVMGAAVAVVLLGCGRPPSITLVPAPPGPADLGPATGLSTPPWDAVVFDLKYRAQTGSADDLQYHSYWGYGGSCGVSWGGSKIPARRYNVRMTQDTGPLAGQLTGTLRLRIE